MDSKMIKRIALAGLFSVTLFLVLVPAFQTLHKGGYEGVPPKYIADDLYYYGRMKEVADGYPFMGNPYFIEYRDAVAPAFFVPDWIAAIPLLLGIPLSSAIILNFFFWSLIFVFLAYLVGRSVNMPPPYSAIVAIISYIEVYWVIFRPVVMQEVFPFFLLFVLALLRWLRNPLQQHSIRFLMITSALSFYVYTYLWQIIFTVLGVVFLHALAQKRWTEVRVLTRVAVGAAMLSLPAIMYMAYQISLPFYWETMNRIGLVNSHLPTLYAYQYGRWAVLLSVLYLCARRWLGDIGKDPQSTGGNDYASLATIYLGIGLFVMTISNVFTGKELELATHVGRFITLWVALFFPFMLWRLWMQRKELWKLSRPKMTVLMVLSLACLGFLWSNLGRSLPFRRIANANSAIVQEYAAPLSWLERREKESVVVWADEDISRYVPILTKHYVLWANPGTLHLMSSADAEDRFLASQFRALTKDEILASYRIFGGAGPLSRHSDTFYKNRLRCILGMDCKPNQSFGEWVGAEKVDALFNRQKETRKDLDIIIKKYHISYLVLDKARDEDTYFKSLPGATKAWENERFIIYAWEQ